VVEEAVKEKRGILERVEVAKEALIGVLKEALQAIPQEVLLEVLGVTEERPS
jgi:hypothetical protein